MSHITHWGSWREWKLWQVAASPVLEGYQILHIGFSVLPIIAGLDKFTQALVNWDLYLAPSIAQMLGANAHRFMQGVGVVEVVVGIGVALKPKIFAYVLSAWLLAIVVNLLMTGANYDIALRDLGLCLGALALARLSHRYDHQFERRTPTVQ